MNHTPNRSGKITSRLALLGPGILVAATGVGAGDLATGAFTGDKVGTTILWSVVLGAFLKYVLNEGLTRWQLATETTLLEGCMHHFGQLFRWTFLAYLVVWSFLVALALMSACGATLHAIIPWRSPSQDKVFYGIFQSLLAVVLVRQGGFRLFERLMSVAIGMMFITVMLTVVALQPNPNDLLTGLFIPDISSLLENSAEGLIWTVALLGGVGGTLTILCYGYWIREIGRQGRESLKTCRIDLAAGYIMTALFGMAMVIIGEQAGPFSAKGSALLVELSATLGETIGPVARWVFLIGAWGAVFTSLFGVWQSVPYLFADFLTLGQSPRTEASAAVRPVVNCESKEYRGYLYGLATIPALGMLVMNFKQAQKIYAVVGALSIPLIALVLLILCGHEKFIGPEFRNRTSTNLLFVLVLLFFAAAGGLSVWSRFQ